MIDVEISAQREITIDIAAPRQIDVDVGVEVVRVAAGDLPAYAGPVTVTPGPAEQILQTANKTLLQDITIAPIPQNYGLITYNGFELMVS